VKISDFELRIAELFIKNHAKNNNETAYK